jgi:hypothetical protein
VQGKGRKEYKFNGWEDSSCAMIDFQCENSKVGKTPHMQCMIDFQCEFSKARKTHLVPCMIDCQNSKVEKIPLVQCIIYFQCENGHEAM